MRQADNQSKRRRKHCLSCGELFEPDRRTKGKQRYCSKNTCQIKRQKHNERAWRLNNPECLQEQYELSRLWHRARPEYSRQRRKANPELLEENRSQTKLRMRKIRIKALFDKSKVILTQLAGSKGDNYYLTQGYKWLLLRLTKASLLWLWLLEAKPLPSGLSKPGSVWDNRKQLERVANCLPRGRLYELSGIFLIITLQTMRGVWMKKPLFKRYYTLGR